MDATKNMKSPLDAPAATSEAFKALGHPHRLAIVQRLIGQAISCETPSGASCTMDPACCGFGALAEELNVSKGTVSHHVKALWQAGLIEKHRDGRRVFCRINEERIAQLRAFLAGDADPSDGERRSNYALADES
jgi:ArsR family transcriptional regulator